MNTFEKKFFSKYIAEGQEMKLVIHKHYIEILGKVIFWLSIVLIPTFLYYYSIAFQTILPFYIIKYFLVLVYMKLIYSIFDWYADVWIVTDDGITDLRWSLLRSHMNNVSFPNVEGLGVEQNGIVDKLLNKGDLVLHKMGTDIFTLKNVFKPYSQIDKIEEMSGEMDYNRKSSITEERFNIVMDTLSRVIENYMGKDEEVISTKKHSEEAIKKAKTQQGAIDLR